MTREQELEAEVARLKEECDRRWRLVEEARRERDDNDRWLKAAREENERLKLEAAVRVGHDRCLRLTPFELNVAESWLTNSLDSADASERQRAAARAVRKMRRLLSPVSNKAAPREPEPTREALLESVVREARAYCEEMLSPEWLADPANRNIFGARVYALLAAAQEPR